MSSIYNPGLETIDTGGMRAQRAHNPMAHDSKFSSVLGGIAMAANVAGPVTVESLAHSGNPKGAAITSAALMGSMGNSASPHMSWGAGVGTKNIGMPGMAPGYPGAGAVGGVGGAGGLQGATQFDSQIDAMFNNNMLFLAMQQKVQHVAQTTQALSNINKTDSDSKLASIRNMRAS